MRVAVVLLLFLVLTSPTFASDDTLIFSGDSSAECAVSSSTEADSVDGTHPPQSGDITDFACRISEAGPDLVLVENGLQYAAGLDYRASDRTVTRSGPLTFSQQAATMSAGEWKKLDTVNHFTSPGVGHTVDELDAICAAANPPCLIKIYGGKQASLRVLRAWNGAAWDDAGNRMFFWGGGHASYGGNEVYTFDFDTLTWARLTEAKPLNFDPGGGRAHPPDGNLDGISDTPPTPHVYDGTEFDPDAGELVVALGTGIYPTCCKTSGYNKSWRFNPDTRTWSSHDGHDYFYASCVYVNESKEMLCLDGVQTRKIRLYFIDNEGTETDCGGNLIGGTQLGRVANVFRDDTSGKYYDLRRNGIHEITPSGCRSSSKLLSAPDDDLKSKFTKFLEQSGAARGGDTKIYMWAGTEKILTFDTVTKKWDMIWNEASRGNAPNTPSEGDGLYRVFDKWRYFPAEGVFAGIADGDPNNGGGWWLWKPGPNPATVDQASLGTLVLDGSTQTTLSVFLPLDSGDRDYDSTAYIEHREVGADSWTRGVDMMRTGPEFVSIARGYEITPKGYAGMVWGLTQATNYEVRVTVTEPDTLAEGSAAAVQIISPTTKALPTSDYTGFGVTAVDGTYTAAQLTAEMTAVSDGAGVGHVFTIGAGVTISGTVEMKTAAPGVNRACGTAAGPIVLRGANKTTSIIDGLGTSGAALYLWCDHVIVENLTIRNANKGVQIWGKKGYRNIGNVTVRNTVITGITNDGINAGGYGLNDIYIADNVVEGPYAKLDTTSGGGLEGIVVTGHDIEVLHNTVSGFVDALGTSYNDEMITKSAAIYQNLVLWSSDDGIEFDFSHRNVVGQQNLISNSGDCLSFQPVWGGPVYAVKNICYNMEHGPYKVKAEQDNPNGLLLLNNTSMQNGYCWLNTGVPTAYMFVLNNLFVCEGTQTKGRTLWFTGDVYTGLNWADYNAWGMNGKFKLGKQYAEDFAAWTAAREGFGANDVLLEGERIFDTLVLDFDDTDGGYLFNEQYRTPTGKHYDLSAGSSARNAGMVIPGITPAGDANPDIGACEPGECDATGTRFGAR